MFIIARNREFSLYSTVGAIFFLNWDGVFFKNIESHVSAKPYCDQRKMCKFVLIKIPEFLSTIFAVTRHQHKSQMALVNLVAFKKIRSHKPSTVKWDLHSCNWYSRWISSSSSSQGLINIMKPLKFAFADIGPFPLLGYTNVPSVS